MVWNTFLYTRVFLGAMMPIWKQKRDGENRMDRGLQREGEGGVIDFIYNTGEFHAMKAPYL